MSMLISGLVTLFVGTVISEILSNFAVWILVRPGFNPPAWVKPLWDRLSERWDVDA